MEEYLLFLQEWFRVGYKYWYQYLARYTNRDTSSLLLAIRKFKRSFLSLNMNPFFYASLSSLAFPLLLNHLARSVGTGSNFFCSLNEVAYYFIKRSQIGGLSHALIRLIICGKSLIKPHQYGPKRAQKVKKIISLDINGLYAGTIGEFCTKSAGFYAIRRLSENFAYETVMEKPHMAHAWVLFLEKVILQKRLRSALSFGGEKKLTFKNGQSAYLDAWEDLSNTAPDGTTVFLGRGYNFHGCLWHAHKECYKEEIESDAMHPRIKDLTWRQVCDRSNELDELISGHPNILEYKVIFECQWKAEIQRSSMLQYWLKNCCHYGPPIVQSRMSQGEAIQHIRHGRICGFVEVSLITPDDQIPRFLQLPPICVRDTITRKNLKGKQKTIAENRGLLKSGQTTIVSKFSVENAVIDTDLLIWYLNNGIQVSRLETIIQFSENIAFKDWIGDITEGRLQADSEGSGIKEKIWKLIGNGSYGMASLNLSKRFDVLFGDLKKSRFWLTRPNFYQSYEAGLKERPTDFFEILYRKRHIRERLPLQFSCEVLNTSKAIVFEVIFNFCGKYFDSKKWCLLGMDTDGWQLASSEMSLEAMVKPELLAEYKRVKDNWLVPDSGPDLNILKRKPLLLKTEMIADLASVHLASKSYIIVDTTSITKSGHKGFSSRLNPELVSLGQFVEAFYSDGTSKTIKMAQLNGFRQNPQSGHMTTHVALRSALTNLAIKFNFCKSGAHCIPRDIPKHLYKSLYPYSHCDVTDMDDMWKAILQAAKDSPVADSIHLK